jgi:hypothetical protein
METSVFKENDFEASNFARLLTRPIISPDLWHTLEKKEKDPLDFPFDYEWWRQDLIQPERYEIQNCSLLITRAAWDNITLAQQVIQDHPALAQQLLICLTPVIYHSNSIQRFLPLRNFQGVIQDQKMIWQGTRWDGSPIRYKTPQFGVIRDEFMFPEGSSPTHKSVHFLVSSPKMAIGKQDFSDASKKWMDQFYFV